MNDLYQSYIHYLNIFFYLAISALERIGTFNVRDWVYRQAGSSITNAELDWIRAKIYDIFVDWIRNIFYGLD